MQAHKRTILQIYKGYTPVILPPANHVIAPPHPSHTQTNLQPHPAEGYRGFTQAHITRQGWWIKTFIQMATAVKLEAPDLRNLIPIGTFADIE